MHTELTACELPGLTIASQHLPGVAPQGPYFQDQNNQLGIPPQDRIASGWDIFVNNTGHEPDMVVFSRAWWDIARFTQHYPEILNNRDDIPPAELEQLMMNTTAVMALIEKRAVPGTLLVYHTTAMGVKKIDDPKQQQIEMMGRHGQLVQMNASGRQVAAERGWSLVDLEAMAQWFAEPQEYLRDLHHPNREFLNNVLNIYLNLASVNRLNRGDHTIYR